MSIEQQIETLERLVAIDSEINELTESIEEKKGELDEVRSEMDGLEERLNADRESVSEMDRTRGELVQEVRQLTTQIDRSRERLGRARSEREAQAAERELDELRKIQRDRDGEIKKLAELGEQARVSISEGEQRHEELSSQLEGSIEGTTRTIDDLRDKLAAKEAERKEVGAKLPSSVFRRYERLASRGRSPVAQTHDGTCLGCFVKLPPMMFHRMLSRVEFEECPNCHRILYYSPPGEGDDDAQDTAEAPS